MNKNIHTYVYIYHIYIHTHTYIIFILFDNIQCKQLWKWKEKLLCPNFWPGSAVRLFSSEASRLNVPTKNPRISPSQMLNLRETGEEKGTVQNGVLDNPGGVNNLVGLDYSWLQTRPSACTLQWLQLLLRSSFGPSAWWERARAMLLCLFVCMCVN